MKVVCSLDVRRLEGLLIERIAARRRGGLLDPVLVLVPTSRLATQLKHRIVDKTGAALGVHVFTRFGLAVQALEHALEVPPSRLPETALLSIVDGIVEQEDVRAADGEGMCSFAGARGALLATLKDLRESSFTPEEAAATLARAKSPRANLLACAYRHYSSTLERLGAEGWSDDPGCVKAAIPHVASYLDRKGIRSAWHHGAYELTGASLELLRAVGAAVETTFLLPADLESPQCAYARRFAEILRKDGSTFEPIQGEPASKPRLALRSVQGAATELRAAALEALSLHRRESLPFEEIAIVARSLEPYVTSIEPVFRETGVPFTTSATRPLSHDPTISALLVLLRVLAQELQRAPVIDLLRRGRFRTTSPRNDVDAWDRWSRAARIAGRISEWRELPGLVENLERGRSRASSDGGAPDSLRESSRKSADALLEILRELEQERLEWQKARSLAEHVDFLTKLAARCLEPAAEGTFDGLARLLDALELAGRSRDAREYDPGEVFSLACSIADMEPMPIQGGEGGGVRVLGLMQARGMVHRAVIWLGFHDGAFPRRPGEDPFLPDSIRVRLAAETGKPIFPKLESVLEERLLLAITLAAARDRVTISFQRADEEGQVRARSSALRDVARYFTGKADARALEADFVPVHPEAHALYLAGAESIGLVPPAVSVAGAAVGARPGDGAAAARTILQALELANADSLAALRCVEILERFQPGEREFDGWTGAPIAPSRRLYPTTVERLTRCPLSFFLRDVLEIRELDTDVVAHRIEDHALGEAAHEALAKLYESLHADGFLTGKPGALDRARDLLGPLWDRALRSKAGPSHERLRGLFGILGERWLGALRDHVDRDLPWVLEKGEPGLLATEQRREANVRVGEGMELRMAGYLDRLLQTEEGAWVDDYKTGRNIADKTDRTSALRGLYLQLPLYREIAAASLGLDPLLVKARLLGIRPGGHEKDREAWLDCGGKIREGMLETIGVSWRLALAGYFPLHSDSDAGNRSYCGYCGYRRTCRRSHAPSLVRVEGDPLLADYRDVWRKSGSGKNEIATLADVRRAGDSKAEEP